VKILVIGGAGFLGTRLVEQLSKNRSYQILVFDTFTNGFPKNPLKKKNILPPISGSVRNYYDVLRCMERFVPDVVFHLAAPQARPETFGNFRECAEINYVGTANVAQACMSVRPHPWKLVFASSLSAGDPQSHHGISKRAAEDLLKSIFFSRLPEMGVKLGILRFGEIYGDSPSFTSPALVNFLVDNMLSGNNISLFSVNEELDNLHIDDAVRACVLAMEVEEQFFKVDIGAGKGIKIRDLVEKLKPLTKHKGKFRYLDTDKVPIKTAIADTRPAERILGFVAQADFDTELKLLVNKRKRKTK